jgi:hypothetical protein
MSKDNKPQPRDLVLYKNYDLYPNKGDGPDISFYQELYKFKSVQDYLNSKKKKKRKKKKIKNRKIAFYLISMSSKKEDENNLDFITDDVTTPIPNSPSVSGANTIGYIDPYTPPNDFYDKDVGTNLDYGVAKDYPDEQKTIDILSDSFEKNKPITPAEPPIQGIPDGIEDKQDQDHTYNVNDRYQRTNSGNISYEGVPFPSTKY